jgi:hypothetical protein
MSRGPRLVAVTFVTSLNTPVLQALRAFAHCESHCEGDDSDPYEGVQRDRDHAMTATMKRFGPRSPVTRTTELTLGVAVSV